MPRFAWTPIKIIVLFTKLNLLHNLPSHCSCQISRLLLSCWLNPLFYWVWEVALSVLSRFCFLCLLLNNSLNFLNKNQFAFKSTFSGREVSFHWSDRLALGSCPSIVVHYQWTGNSYKHIKFIDFEFIFVTCLNRPIVIISCNSISFV